MNFDINYCNDELFNIDENLSLKYVIGTNQDFESLCQKLQDFQYGLMPELKEKGYNLTDDLNEVEGFVLYFKESPIASIGIKKVTQKRCEIVRVFVDENYRGKGFAKMMFRFIENYAGSLGYEETEMIAWTKSTSALALYKKLGYEFSEEKYSEWFDGLKYVELFKHLIMIDVHC